MTEEQIKSLKRGDKFTVEYTVTGKDGIDFICGRVFLDGRSREMKFAEDCDALESATLVTPPPTFEVGDTVRIVPDPLTGHAHNRLSLMDYEIGKEYIITAVDMIGGAACLGGPHRVMSIHCLEIVKKAVKDKYFVKREGSGNAVVTIWDRDTNNEVICYWKTHPNARAAAEAECERLNAAWRKQQEQKGGAE